MIARTLRWLWLAALLLAASAIWLAVRHAPPRIGPWTAALGTATLLLAIHPTLIAGQFLVSRLAGDPVPPRHRLSLRRALACYGGEVAAVMRGVWIDNPFREGRPAPLPAGTRRDVAILFVHGYFCNRSVWYGFMRAATRRGYCCEALTLDDTFAPIASHAQALSMAIDALRSASGARRVAIVAHSMGGLAVRHALTAADVERVVHVFTLGTPHRGTHAARFGRHASVVEMRPDSTWLAAAAARSDAFPRQRYTAIFSWHDDIVYPQSTGRLDGADCVELAGIGHVALVRDRRVRALVLDRLDRESGPQAAAS